MYKLIDGKAISNHVKQRIAAETAELTAKGTKPGLAVILVGEDPASQIYVNSKERACEQVGFYSEKHTLPADTTMTELLALIDRLNNDPKIDGILCQLPLPKGLDETSVINAIAPEKDVDGFHPMNAGELMRKGAVLEPCTPAGCIELLKRYNVPLSGANAVVVGRSNIVGKPVAMMLLRENCTVTVCHSKTRNLREILKNADIVVSANGRPGMITGDMLKEGAAVIDVGINRLEDGSITGDVDFESAKDKAGAITPVPGGVGPMTIAMLLKNTLIAFGVQNG